METEKNNPSFSQTVLHLNHARVGGYAAQTAFFLLLSAIPFLVVLTSLPALFPSLLQSLTPRLPPSLLALLPDESPSAGILFFSAATALWSASRGVAALTRGLNRMYGCEEHRGFFRLRIVALGETLILELFLLFTFAGGEILQRRWGTPGILFRLLGGWSILTLFFLLLYTLLPCRTAPLFCHLPGAAGAALGWILFSGGYRFYVSCVADFSRLYGALSNAVLLMLWLWLCLCILFFGALLNRLLFFP